MPLFRFQAQTSSGELTQNYLTARNEEEALSLLDSRGLKVLSLDRVREVGTPRTQAVDARNLGVVFKQLASLRRAGISLVEALNIVSQQSAPPLGDLLYQVYTDVASGQLSFAQALGKHSAIPKHVVGALRASEESGRITETLEELSQAFSKAAYFRGLVISALTYPVIMLTMAILIALGMVYFLVPALLGNLMEIAGENFVLPLPTRILLATSNLLKSPLFLLASIALLVGGIYYFRRVWAGEGKERETLEEFILKLPLMGELFAKGQMLAVARTLAALAESNLSLPRALSLLEGTLGSRLYAKAIEAIRKKVEIGVPLSFAFREHPHLFSALFRSLLETGERNADLSGMLKEVVRIYEEEYETRLKGLSAALEPLMLIFVGFVIGGIMLAVLLPYFTVIGALSVQ